VAREGNEFRFVFTAFETAHFTVGHKMVTGFYEVLDDGKGGGARIGVCGDPLPSKIPSFNQSVPTNWVHAELQITIFETDQPPGYHVEPTQGNYYRILWTRSFKALH
jgi:hypothetical protein